MYFCTLCYNPGLPFETFFCKENFSENLQFTLHISQIFGKIFLKKDVLECNPGVALTIFARDIVGIAVSVVRKISSRVPKVSLVRKVSPRVPKINLAREMSSGVPKISVVRFYRDKRSLNGHPVVARIARSTERDVPRAFESPKKNWVSFNLSIAPVTSVRRIVRFTRKVKSGAVAIAFSRIRKRECIS